MFRFLFLSLAVLSTLPGLFACDCSAPRPCRSVSKADVIFTGSTLSGGVDANAASARFRVDRAYKGVQSEATIEIDTAANTSCEAVFKIGVRYLVYAGRTNGRIWSTACSGSLPAPEASQDLAFLDLWQQGRAPTQVVGTVSADVRGSDRDLRRYNRMVTSAVVRIVGPDNLARQISVNPDGGFVAVVPAAGRYQVSADLPSWFDRWPPRAVMVPEHGCGEVGFALRPDGQVWGQAIESDGRPARSLALKLVPLGEIPDPEETRTDEQGRFRFRGVLAGSYRLGVNIGNMDDPSPKAPYPPTFFPGVRVEGQAAIVRVGDFENIQLRPFKMPVRLIARIIRVSVTLDTCQPLKGASVSCTPVGRSYWRKQPTDAKGEVSFDAMDAMEYIVDVGIPSYHELANAGYQRAKWIRVPPGRETTNVRLVFRRQ